MLRHAGGPKLLRAGTIEQNEQLASQRTNNDDKNNNDVRRMYCNSNNNVQEAIPENSNYRLIRIFENNHKREK